jgi:hypothetical protein
MPFVAPSNTQCSMRPLPPANSIPYHGPLDLSFWMNRIGLPTLPAATSVPRTTMRLPPAFVFSKRTTVPGSTVKVTPSGTTSGFTISTSPESSMSTGTSPQ